MKISGHLSSTLTMVLGGEQRGQLSKSLDRISMAMDGPQRECSSPKPAFTETLRGENLRLLRKFQ